MVAMLLHSTYASQALFSLEYFTVVRKLFTKFTKLESPQRRPILPFCLLIWKGRMGQKHCTKQNKKYSVGLRIFLAIIIFSHPLPCLFSVHSKSYETFLKE
jgi:hypothetical protein